MMRDILCVAVGGAFGAVARYVSSLGCSALLGERFPWGTLFVNVLGCFLLGWLLRTATLSDSVSDTTKLVVGTGFLGAFTTFSTFGVDTVQLWNESTVAAIGNLSANLIVGIAAVFAGMHLATVLASAN